jgi:hypothetical protein
LTSRGVAFILDACLPDRVIIGCFQIRLRRITTATFKAQTRFCLPPPLRAGKSKPTALRVVVDLELDFISACHTGLDPASSSKKLHRHWIPGQARNDENMKMQSFYLCDTVCLAGLKMMM